MTSSPKRLPPMDYEAFQFLSLKEKVELLLSHIDDVSEMYGEEIVEVISNIEDSKIRLKAYELLLFTDVKEPMILIKDLLSKSSTKDESIIFKTYNIQ